MKQNRRDFLKKTTCGLTMTALATQMEHFGLMSALANNVDSNVGGDYKALVCIFLAGGCDGNNVVIPNHSSTTVSNYASYSAARGTQGLALAQGSLLPITVPSVGNLTYGLHPSLGTVTNGLNNGIHELWAQGKMAVVTNCGTLVTPTTRAQYQGRTVPLPYQLYSHSDQVEQYQSGVAGSASFTGWGGRISDVMTSGSNPGGLVPMITSISGAQIFTAGQTTQSLSIANAGTALNQVLNPAGFNTTAASQARLAAMNQLRSQDLSANYIKAASAITGQAISANQALANYQEVTVTFPTTGIGQQLKQVARMIKKRSDLNVSRQIFYCQLGGFDNHNNQLTDQANLLSQLSQAMRAFYDEMTAQTAQNNVTMFTMTDFSRTFNPAGTGATVGTDHAWANHLMVVGGAVNGGNFYGMNTTNGTPFQTLTFNGPDDADSGSSARGRWIPTTSVDQYAATLARWYGLPETNLSNVFPNIGNFGNSNLGFMTA